MPGNRSRSACASERFFRLLSTSFAVRNSCACSTSRSACASMDVRALASAASMRFRAVAASEPFASVNLDVGKKTA